MWYPLVNIQKTMDNHHVSWENSLFLWPFSIVFCMFTRGYIEWTPEWKSVGTLVKEVLGLFWSTHQSLRKKCDLLLPDRMGPWFRGPGWTSDELFMLKNHPNHVGDMKKMTQSHIIPYLNNMCKTAAFQDSNPMIIVVCQAWPRENGVHLLGKSISKSTTPSWSSK